MQNKFYFLSNDLMTNNFNFDIKEDVEINLLICLEVDKNINIVFNQYLKNSVLKINISIFSFAHANVLVNAKTINHDNDQKTFINLYGLAYNDANIQMYIESIINNQFINSYVNQKLKGILIGENAKISVLPNLHINTNEVNAIHSVNIGGIDLEEIFYLNTKGFNYKQALDLILNSYFSIAYKNNENSLQYIDILKQLHSKYYKGI